MAKCVMVGNNFIVLLSILTSTMPFHFATLEEYYVGGLWLPIGNGVTDGSLVLILVNIFIGVLGSEWWALERDILGMHISLGHLCFWFVFFVQVVAVLRNFYEIFKAYKFPVPNPEHYREPVTLSLLFQQIGAFALLITVFLVLYNTMMPQLTKDYDGTVYLSFFALQLSFVMVHGSMNIMLAHLTQHPYKPWNGIYFLNVVPFAGCIVLTGFFK